MTVRPHKNPRGRETIPKGYSEGPRVHRIRPDIFQIVSDRVPIYKDFFRHPKNRETKSDGHMV